MAVFIVSYDLRKAGQNYENLWKRLGEWKAIRVLDSVWAINANSTPVNIRDDLRKHMDGNDGLIVAETNSAAWNQLNGQTGPTLKGWLESG